MRRLGSDKDSESRKKRNVFISLILLAILVLSTAGYSFLMGDTTSTGDPLSNSTVPPINVGGKWLVTIHGQEFLTSYPPEQTTNITVSTTKSLNSYFDQTLYIDSNNNTEVFSEISSTIGRFSFRVQGACYEECDENLPRKDCSSNLIVWTNSSENKVTQQENCIFIEGDMRTVDAFLFKLLGT